MGLEIAKFFRPRSPQIPPPLTSAQLLERNFRFNQAIENDIFLTFHNPFLWVMTIEAITKANKVKFISEQQIDRMIEYFIDRASVGGNFSVNEVINHSHLAQFRHSFLNRISFNYDQELTAEERYKNEIEKMLRGEVAFVDHRYFHTVSEEVKTFDLIRGSAVAPGFAKSTVWNNHDLREEPVFLKNYHYWNREYYDTTISRIMSTLFPMLQEDELLKAAPCSSHYHLHGHPSIVNRI